MRKISLSLYKVCFSLFTFSISIEHKNNDGRLVQVYRINRGLAYHVMVHSSIYECDFNQYNWSSSKLNSLPNFLIGQKFNFVSIRWRQF